MKPHTSDHSSWMPPGLHKGVGPSSTGRLVFAKRLFNRADALLIFTALSSPRHTVEVASDHVDLLLLHGFWHSFTIDRSGQVGPMPISAQVAVRSVEHEEIFKGRRRVKLSNLK